MNNIVNEMYFENILRNKHKMLISYVVGTILRLFYLFFSENNMNRFRKQFDVQNVLKIIQGDDSEYEGCDSDSEEDIDDTDYTPAKKDMEDDESSGSDSDISGSSDLDLEAARPNTNSGEQNTTSQGKKTFYVEHVHVQHIDLQCEVVIYFF